MDTQKILSYLFDLQQNNNREWYHANKQRYKDANAEFEEMIQTLIVRIGQTDNQILGLIPKELTFKLVRDTRFSKDKSPYNPAFRAHIGPQGKLPIPVGYFVSIMPGNRSIIGGGLFAAMFTQATSMIRDYILIHGEDLEQIIKKKAFAEVFEVKGEALKNVPRGYDASHPQAEYLKNKSWYIEYPVTDATLLDTELFIKEAVDKFKLMKPFNAYLNNALDGFKMPVR